MQTRLETIRMEPLTELHFNGRLLAQPSYIRLVWKWMEVANTLAYCDMITIMDVKSFIILAPGGKVMNFFLRHWQAKYPRGFVPSNFPSAHPHKRELTVPRPLFRQQVTSNIRQSWESLSRMLTSSLFGRSVNNGQKSFLNFDSWSLSYKTFFSSSLTFWTIDNSKRWTALWHGPPTLFWLSGYVANHQLAMAPQSSAKD